MTVSWCYLQKLMWWNSLEEIFLALAAKVPGEKGELIENL